MQKYIINNISGYLVKDLDIQNPNFDYLYQKKKTILLSSFFVFIMYFHQYILLKPLPNP